MANPSPNKCFLCCSPAKKGIHFLAFFICTECEGKIVNSSCTDHSYNFYVEKIRQMWKEVLPATFLMFK
ncbi:MAG: inhibitor of sigma-G Gin [Firmicutes bacterium]|nr:inhibitor of sigma-G Gin [Bacillota bacterium]